MSQIEELSTILEGAFQLKAPQADESLQSSEDYLKELRAKLSERILFFLRTNSDLLFQALYRIDVHEQLVSEAFDLGEIQLVSKRIAELIIERQLQKLSYPYKFSKEN